jgi:hypothetical protein
VERLADPNSVRYRLEREFAPWTLVADQFRDLESRQRHNMRDDDLRATDQAARSTSKALVR